MRESGRPVPIQVRIPNSPPAIGVERAAPVVPDMRKAVELRSLPAVTEALWIREVALHLRSPRQVLAKVEPRNGGSDRRRSSSVYMREVRHDLVFTRSPAGTVSTRVHRLVDLATVQERQARSLR